MYGVVALIIVVLILWVVAEFYVLDFKSHPVILGVLAVPVFLVGLMLRRWRTVRHNKAFKQELDSKLEEIDPERSVKNVIE